MSFANLATSANLLPRVMPPQTARKHNGRIPPPVSLVPTERATAKESLQIWEEEVHQGRSSPDLAHPEHPEGVSLCQP